MPYHVDAVDGIPYLHYDFRYPEVGIGSPRTGNAYFVGDPDNAADTRLINANQENSANGGGNKDDMITYSNS